MTFWRKTIRGTAGAICLLVGLVVGGCGEDASAPDTDTAADATAGAETLHDASVPDTETAADATAGAETLGDAAQTPGTIGKPCAVTADCPGDLQCFETNAATGDGICSKVCTATGDCPSGDFCHILGKQMVCTLPALCDPCKVDEDCAAATPLCAPGKDGKSFCTVACALGDKSCQPGYSCEQYGSAIDDFACRPDYGACSGGGEACAPCQSQGDCKSGTQCLTSADTGERACFATCKVDGDCTTGFSCSPKGICARLVPNADPKKPSSFVQTCAKSDRGYCDPCTDDWQCASGRCASSAGQSFCVEPTECVKANETKDCADGTFCVPSDKGMICAPPPSWKCQGYKACLGKTIPCNDTQICLDGLCKPKP